MSKLLMMEEREKIIYYSKRMNADHLAEGTLGNISIYNPELKLMAITPSGLAYDKTYPEDIVIMDLNDNIVQGDRKPSCEHSLHRAIYLKRPDAGAVVHTHAMFCTTLACLGVPLKSVHYVLAETGASSVPVVPYYIFGSKELAQAVADTLDDHTKGLLLANHGMIAFGENLDCAYGLAQTMEWAAQLQWRCMAVGNPTMVTEEQIQEAIPKFQVYGQKPLEKNCSAE